MLACIRPLHQEIDALSPDAHLPANGAPAVHEAVQIGHEHELGRDLPVVDCPDEDVAVLPPERGKIAEEAAHVELASGRDVAPRVGVHHALDGGAEDAQDDLLVDGIGDAHGASRRHEAQVDDVLEVGVEGGIPLDGAREDRPQDAADRLFPEAREERVEVGGAREDQALFGLLDVGRLDGIGQRHLLLFDDLPGQRVAEPGLALGELP